MAHTVKGRFILITCFLVISVFITFIIFSFNITRSSVMSKEQAYMESSVNVLSKQMQQEYQHIISIAGHMTSQGVVGKQLNKILRAETMFDLGEEKRIYDNFLQTVTAIGRQVELALYFNPDSESIYSSNYPTKQTFSLTEGLNVVRQTPNISLHAIHASQSRYSNRPVLSVSWPSIYINEQDLTIYVEVRTSLPETLQEIQRNRQSDYVLYQLSQDGTVAYCSDPNFEANEYLLQMIASPDPSGFTENLMWSKAVSDFQIGYLLVQTTNNLYASPLVWGENMLAALLVTVPLLVCSVVLFNRTILQKLKMIVTAVDEVRRPELILTNNRTGLLEFDKLMDRFGVLLEYAEQLIAEVKVHEKEKAKLELENLYYQINPHFLMNSLNSLYWMARLSEQDRTSQFVHHLMKLLNYSLGKTSEQPTLRRELEVLKEYVALEQERRPFNVSYAIEEGAYLDAPMPKLFLQPLVENAISHGIDTDGHLSVRVHADQDGVLIVVEDDGCGIEKEKLEQLQTIESILKHGGIGLRYSASMLKTYFGDEASIRIENAAQGGTTVTIRLTLWKEESHDSGSDY